MQYAYSHSNQAGPGELRASLAGRLITPADPEYEEWRQIRNAAIDRHPAFIVRAANAEDVGQVVSFARRSGLELAVRGGGHSFAGHGATEGGVVLDLSDMRGLHVDPERRVAWAQAGVTSGGYTAATAEHGLATGFGDTASVGIGGITLGGGIGWLVRKHGLTVDSLLSAELVTARGRLLHVDARSAPDLFWAIRGGGGNFGVVTRFQYRLHPVDTILGGWLILPASPAVLRSFVATAHAAPDELTMIAHLAPTPPLPFIAPEHHGRLALMVGIVYAGDPEAGQGAVDRLRGLATPLAGAVRLMAYTDVYELGPIGMQRGPMAMRSTFLDDIDALADTIFAQMRSASSPRAMTQIRVLGGAMARVPVDATAFAHRDRRLMLTVAAGYERPSEAPLHEGWVAGYLDALRPQARGVYVNFLGEEGAARVRDAYPGGTYERLAAIKARYDPANLFGLNQNVPPNLVGQARGAGA
jgi:FAD/FMN-containing dehydrogenase